MTWRPTLGALNHGQCVLHGSTIRDAAGVPKDAVCVNLSNNPQLQDISQLNIFALRELYVSCAHPLISLAPLRDAVALTTLDCSGCLAEELARLLDARREGHLPALRQIRAYGLQGTLRVSQQTDLNLALGWKASRSNHPGISVARSELIPQELGTFIQVPPGTTLAAGTAIAEYQVMATLGFHHSHAREETNRQISDRFYTFSIDVSPTCFLLLIGDPFCVAGKINSCIDPNSTTEVVDTSSQNVQFLHVQLNKRYPGCSEVAMYKIEIALTRDLPPGRHELIANYVHK